MAQSVHVDGCRHCRGPGNRMGSGHGGQGHRPRGRRYDEARRGAVEAGGPGSGACRGTERPLAGLRRAFHAVGDRQPHVRGWERSPNADANLLRVLANTSEEFYGRRHRGMEELV